MAPTKLPWLFVRWDSFYYWEIATEGYYPDPEARAFFPVYPLVIGILSKTLGLSTLWSGLTVSILAFLGAGLLIYKWVRIDYGHEYAWWTILSMYLFPVAFFSVAFYAEPLFIFLGVLSLYLARRGQFGASGIAIALAGGTRPHGIFLVIPFVIEFWEQRDFTRAKWMQFVFGLLVLPIGLLAYLIFLAQLVNGNLVEPYRDLLQQNWSTYLTWPWITLIDGLNSVIFSANIQQDWFSRVTVIHDALYAIPGLALSLWAFRRLRFGVAAYLFVSISFFYAVHGPYGYAFDSMPRRLASLPAVYPAIALLLAQLPAKLRWVVLGLFVMLLGVLAAWFASGRWVS
jgi:Gpi18-like mannosyltransferase